MLLMSCVKNQLEQKKPQKSKLMLKLYFHAKILIIPNCFLALCLSSGSYLT